MPLLKGLSFPLRFNSRGSLRTSEGVDKIKENIRAIVLTSIGERLMNPSVGSLGHQALFRNLDFSESQLLKHRIRMGVEAGESRVSVLDVELAQPDIDGQLIVNMTIKLDTSTEFENLTFYL